MLAVGHFAPVRWTAWTKLDPESISVIPSPGTQGPETGLKDPNGSKSPAGIGILLPCLVTVWYWRRLALKGMPWVANSVIVAARAIGRSGWALLRPKVMPTWAG